MKPKVFAPMIGIALVIYLGTGCFSSSAKKQQQQNNYLDDKVTASRIQEALRRNRTYHFPNVQVAETNGVIYLNGFVKTESQKLEDEELARKMPQAKEVKDQISVRP